ncbi:MAG: hypothetical protein K0S71_122 [Clostridia bacterium]|jgi:hypothetical protein|nr:hypothetical protein [Clostridia bacterium]
MSDNNLLGDNNMQDDTNVVSVKKEENLHKKIRGAAAVKMVAVIIGICIAGAALAQVVVPIVLPKVFVADAIKITQKDLVKETKDANEMLGITLREEIMQSEAVQNYFELKLKDMEGEGTEGLKGIIRGIGVSGELKKDKTGSHINGYLAINQDSLELIAAEVYKNQQEVGIVIPKLFEQYISVNLGTFIEDYNKSALYTLTGQSIDEAGYNAVKEYFETYSKQEVNEELVKKVTERSKEAFKQADVKYIGKANAKGSNTGKTYKAYELVFEEDQIKSYIKDVFSMCMQDEAFSDYISTIDAMQTTAGGETLKANINKTIDEFNKEIDKIDFMGLKTKLMIDDKKHIAETISEASLGMNGEVMEIVLDTALLGNHFITDSAQIALTMKSDEEQMGLLVKSDSNYGEMTGQLQHHMSIQVTENESTVGQANLDINYNTEEKENNLVLKASMGTQDEAEFSALLEGTMNLNKTHKNVSVNMHNILLSADGYGENYGLTLEGKYDVQAIKASDIQSKQDNVQYLFKMTQEELMALVQKASMSIAEIGHALIS